MSTPETFQIPVETSEIYESKFVPALFADWAPHVVDLGDVMAGQSVLDVACGTGIVARTAATRLKFFPGRLAAIREMGRVVKPAGTVITMVPSTLDAQPTYRPLVELAAGRAGPEAIAMLSASTPVTRPVFVLTSGAT